MDSRICLYEDWLSWTLREEDRSGNEEAGEFTQEVRVDLVYAADARPLHSVLWTTLNSSAPSSGLVPALDDVLWFDGVTFFQDADNYGAVSFVCFGEREGPAGSPTSQEHLLASGLWQLTNFHCSARFIVWISAYK